MNLTKKAQNGQEDYGGEESGIPKNPVEKQGLARRRVFGILSAVTLAALEGVVWRSRVSAEPFSPHMPLAYEFIPSPNFDDRPINSTVSCLVLHATVEPTTEGTIGIFLDLARKVSAHFVVGRDGRVVQMVPVEKRAWHAGSSVLEGAAHVNDFSVGIEMVNLNDGNDPYNEPQIQAVAGILRFLRSRYDIPDSRIVSHAQIALPAGRKSDPVGFDFERIRTLASQNTQQPVTPPTPLVPLPPVVKP